MFRLRAESDPHEWRAFRTSMYLVLASPVPFGVAEAISIGSAFGRGLLALLALAYGMAVFGVEFTIYARKQPREYAFDEEGVRFEGPGGVTMILRWRFLRSLRIRVTPPRSARKVAVFSFRERVRGRMIAVDVLRHRDVAERIAGFVARYAPDLERKGRTEILAWDPAAARDGEAALRAPGLGPEFYGAMAAWGPAFDFYVTIAAVLIGFPLGTLAYAAMVVAYLSLGAAQLAVARRTIHGTEAGRRGASRSRAVRGSLFAGAAFLILEAAAGLWLLSLL